MENTVLGRTGVNVSRLCMGTMSFGREADEAGAKDLYAACRDAGINFFDCANVYSDGRAEEILGGLMAHERDALVITTKVGSPSPGNEGGLNRRHIALSVENSLRRLGTDRVDVLFVHRFDEAVDIAETLHGLDLLVKSGKVLYLGVSNWAAWQIATALGISAREGLVRFDAIQPMYNLVKRQAEVEILPLALAENMAVTPYSPVGGGLLSGKYRKGQPDGRISTDNMYAKRYGPDWMRDVAGEFAEFAEENGWHPVSLAVAWVASHPAITAPLIGARNVEQLKPSLNALDVPMTAELRAKVSALSPTPAPATDRLEETL
ncbi:aldo/keto reductase [Amaricoccus tamworthensis]|uniref:aldo/keto reductase n=1 Tax=Amaricoccus tamworthensis TaxID=57002 RepID=UPI003C79EDF4